MKPLLEVIDLGTIDYLLALELQEKLVEKRRNGNIPDTLLLLEHNPVYTLGRNASENNIIASPEKLKAMGIDVVRTTRGGEVTYHGPGQLVGYPILNLGSGPNKVVQYVEMLEKVIIKTLEQYGISCKSDPDNRGVWIDNNKIAALGVRITHHITMHGFSLNVSPRMQDYSGIIPCGIQNKGITSLSVMAPQITMDRVKNDLTQSFKDVFKYEKTSMVKSKNRQ